MRHSQVRRHRQPCQPFFQLGLHPNQRRAAVHKPPFLQHAEHPLHPLCRGHVERHGRREVAATPILLVPVMARSEIRSAFGTQSARRTNRVGKGLSLRAREPIGQSHGAFLRLPHPPVQYLDSLHKVTGDVVFTFAANALNVIQNLHPQVRACLQHAANIRQMAL